MQQKNSGVSLLELLIVIGIISILYAIVFKPHLAMFSTMQDQVIRSKLLQAIHLGQSEAITRRETVFIEKISQHWQQGFAVRGSESMLYTFRNHDQHGKLYWRAFPLNKQYLQFMRNGMLQAENGTFWYCTSYFDKPRWAIVVNKTGRAREVLPDKWGNLESDLLLSCD